MFRGLRFFLYYGWKYDKLYVIEKVLAQLIGAVSPLLAAFLPKLLIDELTGARRPGYLAMCIGLLCGGLLLAHALTAFLNQDSFTHRCRVDTAFGMELHRRQAQADYAHVEDPAFQQLRARAQKFLTCDFHGFGYMLDCALGIMGQLLSLAGISAILLSLSGWVAGVFLLLALLGAFVENRAHQKAMALYPQVTATQRGWMYYSHLFEDYRYGKEIRLNSIGEYLLNHEKHYLDQVNRLIGRQNNCYALSSVAGVGIGFVQQAVGYAWVCAQVARGALGLGDFALYTGAVISFGASLRQILKGIVEIRHYDLYFDALDEYMNLPSRLREGGSRTVPPGQHTIEFCDVGFWYNGSERFALRHVSLTLHPGERLSVVGENGAGKSTFIKLLCRLYAPTEGKILLDGVDIAEYDYESYLSLFASVFQDFKLFSLSLRENVALDSGADDGQVLSALRQVGLEKLIAKLPRGLDTPLGRDLEEDGFEPSGGEGQRIAMARALCRNAPIVLLDEPTAALDPRAEHEIYRRFNDIVRSRTVVFISHRMASARFCDRIAVFANGSICEYGSHDQLYAQGGLYRELFDLQKAEP